MYIDLFVHFNTKIALGVNANACLCIESKSPQWLDHDCTYETFCDLDESTGSCEKKVVNFVGETGFTLVYEVRNRFMYIS